MKSFFYRLIHWEFWPVKVVYFPVFFYVVYLGIRFRNFLFFTCVNPNMEASGLFNSSKFKQLQYLPAELKPKTLLFCLPFQFQRLVSDSKQSGISFPFIIKPDKAERGKAVRIIHNKTDLKNYLQTANFDLVVQEYIDYTFEAGVLFYKFPNNDKGHISSIVLKSFLTVQGDGILNVEQLLANDSRNHLYLEKTKINNPDILQYIPKNAENFLIEPIGNHNRGTKFLNGNFMVTPKLEAIFTEISNHLPEFYYGRFDLRASSQEDFLEGKNIKIVEVNGVNSEPAHIYEPGTPLLVGLKTIFWHWKIIYKIAKSNHKKGVKPISFKEFGSLWKNRKL